MMEETFILFHYGTIFDIENFRAIPIIRRLLHV